MIHARDAFDDLFDVLESEGVPERTVVHCFTGTPEDAQACLALGCDISISGVVTFKNAELLRDAVRSVPLERLHVETDSPFLAPVPYRGKANEPAFVTRRGGVRRRTARRELRRGARGDQGEYGPTFPTAVGINIL